MLLIILTAILIILLFFTVWLIVPKLPKIPISSWSSWQLCAGMEELWSTRNPVLLPHRDSRWPVSHQDVWKPDRIMEIDRIDTNGNYTPGNIRFATHQENQQNKLGTVLSRFEQRYCPYAYLQSMSETASTISYGEHWRSTSQKQILRNSTCASIR